MTLSRRISDFFFPRICPVCGGRLSLTEEILCLECLLNLPRTKCYENPADNDVKNLFELQIPIERAVSFMRYLQGADSGNMVKAMKYVGGKTLAFKIGILLAEELSTENPGFFEGIDAIVPVPLTRSRKNERGFNQAEMIARGVAEVTGICVDDKSVKRVHFIQSQTKLNYSHRVDNVKGAFECVMPERLKGKHLLIVDDIVTTGATILSLADCVLEKTKDVTFSVLTVGIRKEMIL